MEFASNPIEIKWIKTELFVENPWNPNRMSRENLKKLTHEIRNKGFAAPVLARPFQGRYQIIDGEHRWKIARDLGLVAIPCVITQLDDVEARIKTLQLNGLKGENEPDRLAKLLHELCETDAIESLAKVLPWPSFEIEQMITMYTKQVESENRPAINTVEIKPPELELYAVVVTADQRKQIDTAIIAAKQNHKLEDDGQALSSICNEYCQS